MNKRMMILLALLGGVGVFIAIDSGRSGTPAVVEAPARKMAKPVTPADDGPAVVASQASAVSADRPVRDIFAVAAPPVAAAPADAAPVPPAAPPPPPLRLLGFREEDGVREAYVLQDGGVVLARAGQTIGARYQVQALGTEDIQIRDREDGRDYRITFGVNQ